MSSVLGSSLVCNAGPLIGLARIQLEWLPFELFPEVIVPEEVCQELLIKDAPDRGPLAKVLERARIHPRQLDLDRLLLAELDAGEASAIMAAMQLGVTLVLLDERKARRIAARVYGLQVKGTAGLLVEAKKHGLIESVGPCLEAMVRGGYFLGPNLIAACRAAAGEA